MAKYVGLAIIGAFWLAVIAATAYRMGWQHALELWGICFGIGLLVAYGVGLATTGDWRCYRMLLP
jgi:preprotein translocase subunit SecY